MRLQTLLSRTQAGPGRTVKKEQEESSPNHVQRVYLISVHKTVARPPLMEDADSITQPRTSIFEVELC